MQQTANFVGRVNKQSALFAGAPTYRVRACQRMFECACQVRQIGEADGGRIAGQGVRQSDRRFTDGAVQFHGPFGQLGAQAARQLVGLVEINIEQRDADAQRADHLDLFFFCGQRHRRRNNQRIKQGFNRRLDRRLNVRVSQRAKQQDSRRCGG